MSGMNARDEMVGIVATSETRSKRDVRGDSLIVTFEIVDNRYPPGDYAVEEEMGFESKKPRFTTSHGPYNVTVLLKASYPFRLTALVVSMVLISILVLCTFLIRMFVRNSLLAGLCYYPAALRLDC